MSNQDSWKIIFPLTEFKSKQQTQDTVKVEDDVASLTSQSEIETQIDEITSKVLELLPVEENENKRDLHSNFKDYIDQLKKLVNTKPILTNSNSSSEGKYSF